MSHARLVLSKKRYINGIVAALFLAVNVGAALSPLNKQKVGATVTNKVTICHRTASYSNPYVILEVDKSAVDGVAGNSGNQADHYGEHKGPVFYPQIPKHTEWGDIIPPVAGAHSGLSWNSDGISVWLNGCELAESGSVKVNKKVDADGNGSYEGSNTTANNLGFDWLLGDDPTLRDMGTSASGVPVGTHDITETGGPASYAFTGWYRTAEEDNSGQHQVNCTHPQGTTLPVSVTVQKNKTAEITLCNQMKKGSITIVKDAQPNDAQDFSFIATGSGVSNFILDDDADPTRSNTKVFSNLTAGTYSFAETPVAGWDLSSAVCSDGSLVTNVQLAAGENVTCIFTNTKRGSIKIVKNTVGGNGTFAFTGTVGVTSLTTVNNTASQTVQNLTPGNYNIAETVPAGWDLTSSTCSDGSTVSAISLSAGENITCTFTNTKRGSISGTKFIVNANGTPVADQTMSNGWTINLVLGGQIVGQTTTDANGNYSFDNLLVGVPYGIAEVLATGWTQITTGNTCTNDSPLVLTAGQNSSGNDFCNFQNGSVNGYKWNDVNGNSNEDKDEEHLSGWTIFIDDNGNGSLDTTEMSTVTDANGDYAFSNLAPGTYMICEVQQANWVQTYPVNDACHEVVIDESGEANQANFGNQGQGKITIIKDSLPDSDQAFEFTGNLTGNAGPNFTLTDDAGDTGNEQRAFNNLPAGTYTVTEPSDTQGWKLTDITCTGGSDAVTHERNAVIKLKAGEEVTCTFTNTKNGEIVVTKYNDLNRNGVQDPSEPVLPDWEFNLTNGACNLPYAARDFLLQTLAAVNNCYDKTQYTDQAGVTTFTDIDPKDYYQLKETIPADSNWNLSNIDCGDRDGGLDGNIYYLGNVAPGETVHCYVGNYQDTGTVTIVKRVTPVTDPGKFNLNINGTAFASNIGDGGTTGAIELVTGNVNISETAGTNTQLNDYESSYVCTDSQGTVASGNGTSLSLSLAKDQDITCTFYNNKGQILGDPVTGGQGAGSILANTGKNLTGAVFAALAIIGLTGALAIAGRSARLNK